MKSNHPHIPKNSQKVVLNTRVNPVIRSLLRQNLKLEPGVTPLAYLSTSAKAITGSVMMCFMLIAWIAPDSLRSFPSHTEQVAAPATEGGDVITILDSQTVVPGYLQRFISIE